MLRKTGRTFGGKRMVALSAAAFSLAMALPRGKTNAQAQNPETVSCRVLEALSSEQHGVVIVIFHQRDPGDRARLGALLRRHSGASVEFQAGDGQRHAATVERLKSCFGRGLLLFKAGTARLSERDEFVVRFPRTSGPGPSNRPTQ